MNPLLFKTGSDQWPAADTLNEAGGKAYQFQAKHALAQYAVTGCLNGTYYADATQQLETVLRLCGQVPVGFIAQTAVYCRERGHMKDMPALLCAALATLDTTVLRSVFDRVIDDGKMLRNFVQIVRSGAAGRKSLGTAPKRMVQRWFERRDDAAVFRASLGQSPSLADVVKMVHPRPATPQRAALYGWLCGRAYEKAALPETVAAFEQWKESRETALPDVPFQMLTAQPLTDAQWGEIARTASWQMTRMNLNTFLRHGVFKDRAMVRLVANRLRDVKSIRKARVFPYQLMAAFVNADPALPGAITEALEKAMETAVENVPSVTGKVWILPDVSGSMHSAATGYRKGSTTKVRCIDVAGLVAAAFLRANAQAQVLPFSDDVVPAKVDPYDSILTNAKALASLPSGGTNCSAPLAWLNRRQEKGDLVIYVSDNESWLDSNHSGRATATMTEWEAFRRQNPKARLICLDIQPYGHSQVPERDDILNVGGFSDAVFEIIAQFAAGKLQTGHWVGAIEAYSGPFA